MVRRMISPAPQTKPKPDVKVRYLADSPQAIVQTVHQLSTYQNLERVVRDTINRVNRR